MAGAWGMPTSGAWSQQVEKEEEEQGGEIQAPAPAPVPTFAQNAAFPTLGDAVKKKESKRDKKPKAQKMNLADFQTSYKPPTASRRPTMNDDQILSSLPTAPRTRGDDDGAPSGLGGAFKDYGGRDRGDGDRGRDRERGGFFGRRDGSQDGSEGGMDDGPSRADADDDWGATRKFVATDKTSSFGGGGGFRDRRDEPREDKEDEGPSRADTTDDWGATRKFAPSSARTSGSGGFEDRPSRGFPERRRDEFEDAGEDSGPSRADTESRWGNKFVPTSSGGGFEDRGSRDRDRSGGGGSFGDRGSSRDREGDTWGRRTPSEGEGPPAAAGSSRPRLKLAPRTKPLPVLEAAPEPKAEERAPEPEPLPSGPPKPRPNPFGAARPREEVLKEKGVDPATVQKEPERQAPVDTWTRKTQQEVEEGMEKLPTEVAQGSATDKPVEATPSDDEDTAAALASQPAAEGEPTVAIEAQDATETKPLLVSEQDPAPAPPVQEAQAQPMAA